MKKQIALLLAAALALSLLAGCSGKAESSTGAETRALAEAVYPEMEVYPNQEDYTDKNTGELDWEGYDEALSSWYSSKYAREALAEPVRESVQQFAMVSLPVFLGDAGTENRVYSPLNLYMALEMLAEVTDGETRQQLLDALGVDSLNALRRQARIIWENSYCDDGTVTEILGSSIWLNQDILFNQNTLNTLAETYYASAYQGEMGSPELNSALQSWLNEQTDGFLKEQAGSVTLDPDTVIALATTVYFRAKWEREFREENNTQEVFHGAAGDETCEFMHQSGEMWYHWGDHYAAISRNLENTGEIWFILPDEGIEVTSLLDDPQVEALINGSGSTWDENSYKHVIVNQSIPKFDISSDLDLAEGLRELGITDVFRSGTADFTPLTQRAEDARDMFLSQAEHAARVAIDEEGIIAAAFTVMVAAGAEAPPEEEVDFILDRPFLFVVQGEGGLTLFAGIVNQI